MRDVKDFLTLLSCFFLHCRWWSLSCLLKVTSVIQRLWRWLVSPEVVEVLDSSSKHKPNGESVHCDALWDWLLYKVGGVIGVVSQMSLSYFIIYHIITQYYISFFDLSFVISRSTKETFFRFMCLLYIKHNFNTYCTLYY